MKNSNARYRIAIGMTLFSVDLYFASRGLTPHAGHTLSSFLAQMILRGPLIAATTKEFHIHGSWEDPQVTELPRRSVPKAGADGVGKPPAAAAGSQEKP